MDKQVELIERNLDVTRVGCKFSRVKSIERQSYRGRAARVIANGKAGHASTTDGLTDDQLVQRASEMAHVTVPKTLSFPNEFITDQQASSDVDQLTDTDLRDWTRQMLRTMRQNNPHLAIELNVSRIKEDVALRNTNGGEAHLSRSWLEAETWIERHEDGEVLVALDRFATAQVDDSHLDFARRMARRFRWARKPIEPVSGPQSVIFSPSAFASLLQPMLMAFNGSFAFNTNSRGGKRRSGFASKLGQQEFDPKFSLFDDATLPARPYSAWVDHEGTRSQCTPLIENGVVTGFYHNLISAAQAEVSSTGNGWRDMLEPPAARAHQRARAGRRCDVGRHAEEHERRPADRSDRRQRRSDRVNGRLLAHHRAGVPDQARARGGLRARGQRQRRSVSRAAKHRGAELRRLLERRHLHAVHSIGEHHRFGLKFRIIAVLED